MKHHYKKIILPFLFLILLPFFTTAQITFEKIYPTNLIQSGRDVLPTNDGGYLIAGVATTSVGDSNIYILKTNSIGDTLWTKKFGGSQPEYLYTLLPSGDGNFFIVGYTKSYGAGKYDVWLLKITPTGNLLWSKTYGTAGDEMGHDLIPTSDGNFMITGFSNSDAFLLKIDPSGNVIWNKTYGGPQYETSHSVKECLDGGFIFTGQTFSYGMGLGDVYVVKTNSIGDTLWTKTYGGVYADEGCYVLANADGTYVIDAELSSNNTLAGLDVWLIKTDATGNTIWNKTYGGNDKDVTHYVQPTTDGGYIISAISRSFGWINPDMWLVKTNSIGDTLWTRHFGSWYHDHSYAVKQTADGGYIAIGHSENNLSITQIMFVKLDGQGLVPVEEFALNTLFSVYPNPTNGVINIEMGMLSSSTLRVSNALGEIVFTEKLETSGINNNKILDLRNNRSGIYLVSIESEKGLRTKKIILE